MFKRFFICAVLTAVMLTGSAKNGHSGSEAGQFFISPMVGGHIFEGNQHPFKTGEKLDNGVTFGLGLGYYLTNALGSELMLNVAPTNGQPGDFNVKVFSGRLDLFYDILPENNLVPYVAGGLGAIRFCNSDLKDDTDFMVNYGAGLKYYLNESVALRGDVRHLISFDKTHSNIVYTVGMVFNLGGSKKPVQARSTAVEEERREYKDTADRCTGVPEGATTDSRGCWVIDDLYFETGTSVIKKGPHNNLDEVVTVMEKNPKLKVEVQGYADNRGSAEFNQSLSEKRAEAVRDYIVSKGIDKDRIKAKGYGSSNPVMSNDTAEGRAKNRRVELKPIY